MRSTRWIVVIGVLFGSVGGLLAAAPAHAACDGPQISLSAPQVAPGSELTVHGRWFAAECNDMIRPGQDQPDPSPPATGIRLEFVQGNRTVPLATVDAGPAPEHEFDAVISVPADARPGRAGIVAHSIRGPASADFTVGRRAFARTGGDAGLLALGSWLVAVGMLLLAAIRPRVGGPATALPRRRSRRW